MSYDIYLQGFDHGQAADRDGREARHLLLAASESHELAYQYVHVVVGDSEADVYGIPDAGKPLTTLMFSRIAGDDGAHDLLVAIARAANLVVLPPGAPVCLVDDAQRQHLPPELREGATEMIATGRALREVIERS